MTENSVFKLNKMTFVVIRKMPIKTIANNRSKFKNDKS